MRKGQSNKKNVKKGGSKTTPNRQLKKWGERGKKTSETNVEQ